MKKKLLILAVAGFALASCSSDETVNSLATSDANEISFRAAVGGLTRAADINASTLETTGFYVSARVHSDNSEYFTDAAYTTFETVSETKTWTSSTTYYWPSTASLDFYAYAPQVTGQISGHTNYKTFVVTPDATTNTNTQVDLIFAVATEKTRANSASGVQLQFQHAESRISFYAKNTSTTLDFTITGNISICNVNTVGTFVYSALENGKIKFGDWTPTTPGNYIQTAGTQSFPAETTSPVAISNNLILIPQTITAASAYSGAEGTGITTGSYVKIPLTIKQRGTSTVIASGDAIWPLPAPTEGKWSPGYHYTYTIDLIGGGYKSTNSDADSGLDPMLEGGEIKFITVGVDTWGDPTATDVGM